jgi:hypothetical protein
VNTPWYEQEYCGLLFDDSNKEIYNKLVDELRARGYASIVLTNDPRLIAASKLCGYDSLQVTVRGVESFMKC